jgi:formate-nitrite transporter family protein
MSDLGARRGDGGEEAPLKSYRTILEQEVEQAEEELNRPAHGLLVSGVLAGLGVGVSLLLMAVLESTAGALPEPARGLLMANVFTVGFILVILARTDLFTEYTTLAILPVLTGDAPLRRLARLWGYVLSANLVGIALFAVFVAFVGPRLGRVDVDALGRLAAPVLAPSAVVLVLSASVAGWLMGLLSWLVTAGRDTISQVFFVWLVAFAIGYGELHHVVTGSGKVLAAWFAGQGPGAADFGGLLLWVALGNALGGIAFAVLIRYSLVIRTTGASSGGRRRGRS